MRSGTSKHWRVRTGLLALIIAVFLGVAGTKVATVVGADGPGVRIDPADTTVGANSSVSVNVVATAPAAGLGAWGINVTYPPSVLTVTECATSIQNASSLCNKNYSSNTIRLNGASALGVSGTPTLATITFLGTGVAGSSGALHLTLDLFADPQSNLVSPNTADGVIRLAVLPTTTATPANPATPTPTPNPTVSSTATSSPTQTPGPTSSGYASLRLTPSTATSALNGTVSIAIALDSTTQPIDGAEVFLDFDPTTFQVVDAAGQLATKVETPPTSLNQVLANSVDPTKGYISLAVGTLDKPAPSGTFTIGRFWLKGLKLTGGNGSPITFASDADHNRKTNITLAGTSVLGAAVGGSYAVAQASLTGSVHLQGRETISGKAFRVPLHFDFYPLGGSTHSLSMDSVTDDNGAFQLTDLLPGTYDVRVKHGHSLANKKTGVLIAAGANNLDLGTLLEGDADGDNAINIVDFSILANTFGKKRGDPGFDERADFNNSDAVNIVDFSLVASNFGKFGDQLIP